MPRDPKSGNSGSSDVTKPDKSDEPIGMPNVKPEIQKEIERLTKELIQDMKGIIVANVNYKSIDFIPEDEPDINNEVDFIKEEWQLIIKQLYDQILMSDRSSPDYVKFLDMFTVVYNTSNGEAKVTLNLEFSGFGADDLALYIDKVKRTNDVETRRT